MVVVDACMEAGATGERSGTGSRLRKKRSSYRLSPGALGHMQTGSKRSSAEHAQTQMQMQMGSTLQQQQEEHQQQQHGGMPVANISGSRQISPMLTGVGSRKNSECEMEPDIRRMRTEGDASDQPVMADSTHPTHGAWNGNGTGNWQEAKGAPGNWCSCLSGADRQQQQQQHHHPSGAHARTGTGTGTGLQLAISPSTPVSLTPSAPPMPDRNRDRGWDCLFGTHAETKKGEQMGAGGAWEGEGAGAGVLVSTRTTLTVPKDLHSPVTASTQIFTHYRTPGGRGVGGADGGGMLVLFFL